MDKNIFDVVLQKNEKVLWVNGVNQFAYMMKSMGKVLFASLFASIFLGTFVSIPFVAFRDNKIANIFETQMLVGVSIFLLGMLIGLIVSYFSSKNTYFAITDKRILIKTGAFNQRFTHYSLVNIGTIQVSGSFLDSKGENASASLSITTKDFHTNTDGNKIPRVITISSLKDAYNAYQLLSEKTDGNNEAFRIKNVD